MFKYILIIAIGFGGYKALQAQGVINNFSGSAVTSKQYSFYVEFPEKPQEMTQNLNLPGFGEFKVKQYSINKPDFNCSVIVSEYLDAAKLPGDIYDIIDSYKTDLLTTFDSNIVNEGFIYSGSMSGYQFDLEMADERQLQSRLFNQDNKVYNLLCLYEDKTEQVSEANDFLDSFEFIAI